MAVRETVVQIAAPGTGAKIRNLRIDRVEDDGTVTATMQQVVSIADEDGKLLDVVDHDYHAAVLERLDGILSTLREMGSFSTNKRLDSEVRPSFHGLTKKGR